LFSLFAFVLIVILRLVVSFLAITHNLEGGRNSILLINSIEIYCFWSGVIIGHVFFILALVRSRSANSNQIPADDNDLLSEVAG
jgi:hypothetical protein